MGISDNVLYRTFYGIKTVNWKSSFGSIIDDQYILVDDYLSDGCDTEDSSLASDTYEFLYPHHIKKKYWLEGVAQGQITLTASTASSVITSYRITICKVTDDNIKEELKSTGWITYGLPITLNYDAVNGIGEEIVLPFFINIWDEQELTEHDRLYIKIQVNADANGYLMHSNDVTWKDFYIDIPLRLS